MSFDENKDCKFKEFTSYSEIIDKLIDSIDSSDSTTLTLIKIGIQCVDVEHTFIVRDISLVNVSDDSIEFKIYYNVFHYTKDVEFCSVMEVENESKVDFIFSLFWNYKLCCECLELIKKEEELCENCMFHKMRQQYGLYKGYIESYDTCVICQEDVYHCKLQCGHHIHHLCLLKLHNQMWYDSHCDIKCPVCRKELTECDKNRFFTSPI